MLLSLDLKSKLQHATILHIISDIAYKSKLATVQICPCPVYDGIVFNLVMNCINAMSDSVL